MKAQLQLRREDYFKLIRASIEEHARQSLLVFQEIEPMVAPLFAPYFRH